MGTSKYVMRFIVSIVSAIAGCASSLLVAQDTAGERFRKVLAEIDENCRKLKMGPYLDASDPQYAYKRQSSDCNILMLAPQDWRAAKRVKLESQQYPVPEHWLSTPEGRFAHGIKLPASVQLDALDMKEMSPQQFFAKLCQTYAGEFVLSRANDVKGLLQSRPFEPFASGYRDLVFWTREKGDLSDTPQNAFVQPPIGEYEFLEMRRIKSGTKSPMLVRFERGPVSGATRSINATTRDSRYVTVPYVVVEREIAAPSARYAYTWRGIWPGTGVEHGIEGYELIVYQVQPLQVLGVRREFLRHAPHPDHSDKRMTITRSCSETKQMKVPSEFILSVLSVQTR